MRKKLLFACLMAAAVSFTACEDYDDTEIKSDIEALKEWQVTVEEELASLQTLMNALNAKEYVTEIVTVTDRNGDVLGYEITFSGGDTIKIANGTDGTDGTDGEDGTNGSNGSNGEDGDSVFDAENPIIVNTDGTITFVLADGETTYTVYTFVDTTIELEKDYLAEGENVITVALPTSLTEDNYSAMMVEIIDENGDSASDITISKAGTVADVEWTVTAGEPIFDDEDVLYRKAVVTVNAVQAVTADLDLNVLFKVTFVDSDNF